jgi:hypothetical protein
MDMMSLDWVLFLPQLLMDPSGAASAAAEASAEELPAPYRGTGTSVSTFAFEIPNLARATNKPRREEEA